jgi:lysophospholipase L1-like esterase
VLDGKPGREPGVREFLTNGEKPDVVLLMIGNNDIYKGFIKDTRYIPLQLDSLYDQVKTLEP